MATTMTDQFTKPVTTTNGSSTLDMIAPRISGT
jgi:hypothetical protein